MSLQLLKVFVIERLRVAAEEIFGAVERTITDYEEMSPRNRLHDVLKHEEVHREVSLKATLSEEEAPVEQQHAHQWNAILDQGTETSPFQEPQEHWSCRDEPEANTFTPTLIPTSAKCDYSTNWSTQTSFNRERHCQPSTSMEQIQTPRGGGCRASETASDWKPLPLVTSEAEIEDIGGDDWIKNGGHKSNVKTMKTKRRRRRPKETEVGYTSREPGSLLNLNSFSEDHGLFRCKVCGESFRGRSYLMKHVRVHSTDMTGLHPDRHVISVENAVEHLQAHREENLCESCGKTFTQKSHLKRHMWVHTGQKPHCCKDCGKTFGRSESLRIHRRVHTAERPYVCGVCGNGFNQKGNLDAHMRSHTGEKPYGCGVCLKAFAHKKDMVRHMKTHIETQHSD